MKYFILLILSAFLFVSGQAMAQPPCPCDTEELPNGTTGNDIVAALCPNGVPLPNVFTLVDAEIVEILSPSQAYGVGLIPGEGTVCVIAEQGSNTLFIELDDQELLDCRQRLIQACSLNIRPIPTLSEWGMIAMAGVLGMIGLFVAARRRKAAA